MKDVMKDELYEEYYMRYAALNRSKDSKTSIYARGQYDGFTAALNCLALLEEFKEKLEEDEQEKNTFVSV